MDLQSPLSQQARPESFKPKVVELYEDEHAELTEGFWRELFLLKPDTSSLRAILSHIDAEELVRDHQNSSQQLFCRAFEHISYGTSTTDEAALDTLTVFLRCVLEKKYTSPSSDIIVVLAGLENVDSVFAGFVTSLDDAMRNSRRLPVRHKAVRVAVTAVSGAFQTGLISYFINRDLFPSILNLLFEGTDIETARLSLVLFTLLVNYNKFEFQNLYQLRLEDLAITSSINAIIACIGSASQVCRNRYRVVQDDQSGGWNLGGALSWLGLGNMVRLQALQLAATDEAADKMFSELPPAEATILLSTYDAVYANKVFRLNFVSIQPDNKQDGFAFGNFLSLTSYLVQHAQRSARASLYARLNLMILQILVDDGEVVGKLCSSEHAANIALCRQRQPVLPYVREERTLAAVVVDVVIAGIDHNMIQLNDELYHLLLCVLLRLISYLAHTHTRLIYHYSELYRSLFTLLTYLTTTVISSPSKVSVVTTLVQILSLSLSAGDTFISDSLPYDDLFYRTYTAHSTLLQLRSTYFPTSTPTMETLIETSAHCKTILEQHKESTGKMPGNPKEIGKVLRQNFESAGFGVGEGLRLAEGLGTYREVEWRGLLKRIARVVVQDAKELVERES